MNNEANRYCTNCGAEVPAGADFCPNCGQAVSQEEEEQPPPQAVPSTQEAPTQQAPAAPPQPPAFQPPGGGAAAAPVGSRRGLMLGGIAAAAVLGFLILVVVVALAAFLLWPRGGTTGTGGDGGGGGGGTTGTGGGGSEVSCLGGPLGDILQTQVGDWDLNENSVQQVPEVLEVGAAEGLKMKYTKQDGSLVFHWLTAFPSADGANAWIQDGADYWSEEGLKTLEQGPLEDSETGEQYGSYVLMEGKNEGNPVQLMLWTNDCVEAEVLGGGDNAVDFFKESSSY